MLFRRVACRDSCSLLPSRELKSNTPSDVLEWFVHSMNRYVGIGVQTSFAEVYRALPRIENHRQRTTRGDAAQGSEADLLAAAGGDDEQDSVAPVLFSHAQDVSELVGMPASPVAPLVGRLMTPGAQGSSCLRRYTRARLPRTSLGLSSQEGRGKGRVVESTIDVAEQSRRCMGGG